MTVASNQIHYACTKTGWSPAKPRTAPSQQTTQREAFCRSIAGMPMSHWMFDSCTRVDTGWHLRRRPNHHPQAVRRPSITT